VKVLLDENLDHALRRLLGPHEVVTVNFMGWTGLKNGELILAAESNGIDVLITGDQTLHDEQSQTGRRIAILALSAIQLPIIKKHLPKIIDAIDNAAPGSFQMVDCGKFSRKKPADPRGES
jgi:predicted nuclease of predicted toxin-antitoxin system